ncbi:hypothetical protein HN709_04285 [Candidatus Peregrinibacteria bacterium]|jgi:hypothetical protein|nr:hypothetical protein [Candidatus Peregrinibacteria bacterium]MBT7736882.1 hypothetical protein [Candidatus Peregrinibacteria bacterium]
MTTQDPNQKSGENKKSPYLTDSAREVKDEMDVAYVEFREPREELDDESIVKKGNKIVRKEADLNEKVDFRIALADSRSTLVADDNLTSRQKTIRERFIGKLEPAVIETEMGLDTNRGSAAA